MRLHRFTNYLLRHTWLAFALTFAISFAPLLGTLGLPFTVLGMLGTLGILFALLITLCKSITEGALLTLTATIPALIIFYLISGNNKIELPFFAMWAGVGIAITSNVLSWAFAVMLKRKATWSTIIQTAALIGVLIISVIHLIYPDIASWWGDQFTQMHAFAAKTGVVKASILTDEQAEWINYIQPSITGILVSFILLDTLTKAAIARWWQALVYQRGMLARELHNIRLSQLAGGLFIASLILSHFGNGVILDILPVLYLLFGVAGLSLIHYFFKQLRSPTVWFWLAIMYVTIYFTLTLSIKILAFLALFDVWFDLRKRFVKA